MIQCITSYCHKSVSDVVYESMKNYFCAFLLLPLLLSTAALASGTTLTLSEFIAKAEKESPDLAVEKANLSISESRASGIRINPPMVGLMQMKQGSSTTNGIEISQEIPFPTKMAQNKKVRDLEHEAQKETAIIKKLWSLQMQDEPTLIFGLRLSVFRY